MRRRKVGCIDGRVRAQALRENLHADPVNAWKGGLRGRALHQLAQRVADKAYRLPAAEYKECNDWLDKKYPVRTEKPEEDTGTSLFDVMHAK